MEWTIKQEQLHIEENISDESTFQNNDYPKKITSKEGENQEIYLFEDDVNKKNVMEMSNNTNNMTQQMDQQPSSVNGALGNTMNMMLRKITAMEKRQKSLETKIDKLLDYLKLENNINEVAELPKVPINSIQELLELEEELLDETKTKALITELRRIGGSGERDAVLKILPKIFGLELGRTCSLKGKLTNFKLEGTGIISVIKNAVLHNYPMLKNEIFNLAITDWFRGGALRYKRSIKTNS